MYFSAYQSRKRDRSPPSDFATPFNSPAIGIVTSPTLDVLAKRQRTGRSIGGVLEQIEVRGQSIPPLHYDSEISGNVHQIPENGHGHLDANHDGHEPETMSSQYAEKRRARQWEQLNAPQPNSPPFKTPSHPPPGIRERINPDANEDLGYFASPATHNPQKQSRPQFKHHMSSSPIRHQPPGSSPFKSSGSSSQFTARDVRSSGTTRAEELEDEDEGMDQEDLRRDWGEHYARPNGLLLSLVCYHDSIRRHSAYNQHRSRQSQPRVPTTPHNHHSENMLSSPYRPASSRTHSYRDEHDVGYDNLEDDRSSPNTGDTSVEVDNQYEETNRLLGQLELVRRQRFHTE